MPMFHQNTVHTVTLTHGAAIDGWGVVELIGVETFGHGIVGEPRGTGGALMFVPWSSIARITIA